MFFTKSDIPDRTRRSITILLQRRLSDLLELTLELKQALWNIRGPEVVSLRGLFDTLHSEAASGADSIAERIAQLGEIAFATSQSVSETTSLPEYPAKITQGFDHVAHLSTAFALFSNSLRADAEILSSANDPASSDLLAHVSRSAERSLWLLESHFAVGSVSQALPVSKERKAG